jgi:phospholipase C
MKHQSLWSKACACVAITALVQPNYGVAQQELPQSNARAIQSARPTLPSKETAEIAPRSSDEVAAKIIPAGKYPVYDDPVKLALLQKKIKYVFVLFQENRSFDFYFGTYPGANGLFSQSAANTPGFVQPIVETDGTVGTISPFKIPQSVVNTSGATVLLYPEDIDSVNHAHAGIDAKLNLNVNHIPQNNRYAFTEQGLKGTLSADGKTYTGPAPTQAQKQKGELVMSHVDCDTAPFLWNYADRFTLLDEFFDTVIGPSTPNAIAMIAGQSGETQWVRHPELASNVNTTNAQLPVTADPQPFWGSALDYLTPPSEKQPVDNPGGVSSNPSSNLTFATLPLSFMGNKIETTTAADLNPAFDLLDVREDIKKIAGDNNKPVNWGWFQEGYDHEPTDPVGPATNLDYIAHHNAPQYFGYEANNPVETKAHMKGLGDFYTAIKNNALPAAGGVFYVRGGYGNLDGLTPRSPSPAVQADFKGNDDHPGYSDTQISEAVLADSINAIASSKYWKDSAIIITYDETDGLYDHTQPWIRSFDPLGAALDQGPRIPTIVVSPYSKAHVVDHERSEHGSIIRFIDDLFNLTPLADLPDEYGARIKGSEVYGQPSLGPSDGHVVGVGNLFGAFDDARLDGKEPPLPASYAMIPAADITSLPHFGAQGCRALQITPTDVVNGKLIDPAPADFNPRPGSNPGLPTSGTWPSN